MKGIDSIGRADEFAGSEVLVPGAELKAPDEGRLYDFALVGCSVVTTAGRPVGVVRDVAAIGESTLLVVEGDPGPKEVLIPLSRHICVAIDPEGRQIVIDPPDGLLDLNEI